ncbi:ABC transporter substrate-binding protein [Pseudonocardia sp. TRM90224]|uniref:ABC transporter substrate-binding protein n=1 Tax=Pseudonocardia sp. TRM90224 TaxID=2812678 RepID=UPI001E2EA454|nr:extracellular solute-binding protein [Pseudonocardia sp. TRM90224]
MGSIRKSATAAAAVLAVAGVLAACGGTAQPPAAGGKTAISVVSLKPGSEKAAFDAFEAQVAQFEAANPDTDVTSQEYEWTGPTFTAQLAGGTLPTVFTVPFTDGKGLVERRQLADITDHVKSFGYADKFNKTVLAAGRSDDGRIYAVPTEAYGVGLQYNRTLFTQAGLDPEKPPTTWADVRNYAKQIAERTGQAGYAQMTQENTGGWMLTTLTYAHGGRMQVAAGEKVEATIDNPGAKAALGLLRDMRWTDNSMGSNFLLDWSGINQEFAAGKIGMYMGGSDVYTSLKQQNNINPADYGLAVLPLVPGAQSGLLGGGTLAAVNVKATPEQQAAAAKWIDFYYMAKLTKKDAAELDAKTLAASDQPVGVPKLPVFDKATLSQYDEWIKPYVNVPVAQMTSFTNGIFEQELAGEPVSHTQEMYAVLDSVVQAVLTDPAANIDALLANADAEVQSILDRG